MSYSPLQARDRHGRWVAKAGNAAFSAATRTVGAGKKAPKAKGSTKGGSNRNSGFIPYARFNKRSQTAGFNRGAKITKHHRVVVGSYVRIESTRRHTATDKIAGKAAGRIFPKGTRRGRAASAFKSNFSINNPALRGTTKKGNTIHLGTSRGAGPTVVVRRGRKRTSQAKSAAGVRKYDTRMRAISGAKAAKVKKRPARRKAARKRR